MAKANNRRPGKPRRKTRRPKKAPKRNLLAMMSRSDYRAIAHGRMMTDPCNAPLDHGVYPGQKGFISRCSQVFPVNLTATQTAFLLTVTPAAALSYSVAATDASAAIAVGYAQTFVPGAAYLNTNARSVRALGACFEFFTNAAPLNAQGTFYYGVVPHSVIANGAPNIGAVLPNLQYMSKVNADAYEVKWRPGAKDEFYTTPNQNVSGAEWDDLNSLVLCGSGFPVSSSITIKVTIIYEWLPATNLGLATPAAQGASSVKASQVVAHLDESHQHWWAGRAGDAGKFIWNHGGKKLASFATELASQEAAKAVIRSLERGAESAAMALV